MTDIKISICASAIRAERWHIFLNSLMNTKVPYEVIFAGDQTPQLNPQDYLTYPCPEFKFLFTKVKPAQCYELCFREAEGELIHYTADDADYSHEQITFKDPIDRIYQHYQEFQKQYGDNKTIVAMRPFECGADVWGWHHLMGDKQNTPRMAPFGIMNREWLMKLGGYDKNFISGQSENDLVMRGLEDGGRVELCMDCMLWVHHNIHGNDTNMRKPYVHDRKILESSWINADGTVSPTRLVPFAPFVDDGLQLETQGERGQW